MEPVGKSEVTNLLDVVRRLDHYPEEYTIYGVRKDGCWRADCLAVVWPEAEDHQPEQVILGVPMEYFLEVSVACEVRDSCHHHLGRGNTTDEILLGLLIYYAENDAYPDADWRP